MIAGFRLSKIVIIQSLELHEFKTGKNLHDYIRAQVTGVNLEIPVEFHECENRFEFLQILEQLTTEAKARGEIPLVHVECHGSIDGGLEFQNGSCLSWPELAAVLLALNVACRFNLLFAVSACFGAHFVGQMAVISPSPCWCVVAPTEKVDPGELLGGFRTFYRIFLRSSDVGMGVAELQKVRLSHGRWFGQPAETWFEQVVINYVKTYCSEKATRIRAKGIFREAKRAYGVTKSIGSIMRDFRRKHREDFLDKYFATYFLTADIPENVQRFAGARARIELQLAKLRDTNEYII